MTSDQNTPNVRHQVEALLFSAGKHMDIDMLATLTENTPQKIKKVLEGLKEEYNNRDSSLMIVEEGKTWKIHVRERYLDLVRKIVADTELARPVLETLAVAAYKSPCMQSDVIKIRGQNAYEHISILVDMGFITREHFGRSFKLKLTEKFFEYFEVDGQTGIKELFSGIQAPIKKSDAAAQLQDAAAEAQLLLNNVAADDASEPKANARSATVEDEDEFDSEDDDSQDNAQEKQSPP